LAIFSNFWQYLAFKAFSAISGNICKFKAIFGLLCQIFWNFLTILGNFWIFWNFLAFFKQFWHFGHVWHFWHFWHFLIIFCIFSILAIFGAKTNAG
jgi:hypothetical protein